MEGKQNNTWSLFILPVIWGTYYVASQKLVGYTSVFVSGLLIRLVTFFLLLLIMCKKGEIGNLFRVKGARHRLCIIGTLGFLLDVTAFIGLSLSSAATGTALLKTDVIMVNLISVLIYKKKLNWKSWGYTFIMLFGVFMVMGVNFTNFKISDKGNIFFLLSALFVSINAFVIKGTQNKKNVEIPVSDDVIAFYNNGITMILFAISAIVTGTVGQVKNVFADGHVVLAMALAALGQTMVYVVYYYNLRNYAVWLVKICLLLMPIFSALVTLVLFHEKLAIMQYVGMFIVILGAIGILMQQRTTDEIQEKESN